MSALIFSGGALALTGTIISNLFFTVDAGERAILFDRAFGGIREKIYGEGMHFYIPMFQKPITFTIRLQPKTIASQTGTKDLQTVDIALRILYRPVENQLPNIYLKLGLNYDERILPSVGKETLKSVIAQYDADQILQSRERISQEIRQQMILSAQEFNILLDDVSFIHLGFMKDYAYAIEQKQVAQQNVEKQRYIVQRDEEDKLAQIIRSEGEAEAAQLINQAVKKFGGAQIEIKRLEAAKQIAETLSKSQNITFVPSGSEGKGQNLLLNMRV
ncbi:prohibitin, putative [Ichthyophthirius multifiliis]|uniref:Prohibitin n=1 Tax=Ichthyophthirius multifiliis TaxID=5932 RepID=G0QL47_ICHMU|nr:prohibitin, putative [Ichthyophthirius multifiliis]EGR34058.1 prohibitin, putative [Ichthyophthirius multifiliis]|eukprot:XP_004039362.1 prohibitin, putative [Ichthyophthirius multifiliis]